MSSLKNRSKEYQETMPKVVLMVNDKAACNMNCECCYLSYEGVRTPDSAVRAVEGLRPRYRVTIAGSETLVDPRYLEAYKRAGQKYLLTNGLLLDKKPCLYDALQDSGIEELQLSMDFGGEKGDERNSKEMVERVTRAAKDRGFWVRLACIINADNYRAAGQMCNQAADIGADAVFLTRYVKSGSAVFQDKKVLTTAQKEEFFQLASEIRKKFRQDKLDIRLNGNFGPKKESAGEALAARNAYCLAGRKLFAVAPNNNVYGCPYLMTEPMGRLVGESRLEITRDLCGGDRSDCLLLNG